MHITGGSSLRLSLFLLPQRPDRHLVKIISRIFSLAVDQQIFFFKHQVLPFVFAHFKIRDQLNGISWTGIFAITTKMQREKLILKNSG